MQVCLCLYETSLEVHPGLVVLQLGPQGLAVFLELPRFYDEAVWDSKALYFGDGIACRCPVINALVESRIETLERLVGVEWLPQIGVVHREVRGGDLHIVAVCVAY